MQIQFKPYTAEARQACLQLFDANCPTFFAENEQADYARFLDSASKGYQLCIADQQLIGAFGLLGPQAKRKSLRWILVHLAVHGQGIGAAIMRQILAQAAAEQVSVIDIHASHLSAPFFAKSGAVVLREIADGWGPAMHRVDMELVL